MPKRPNLLLITTDQQRGDCLGCDGHPCVETPNLDAIAESGARFRNAYTAVPSTTPARAAMMTGMNQWNHGRLTMTGSDSLEYPATIAGELAAAGYQTRAVGKMMVYPQRKLYGFHHTVLDESGRRPGRFTSDYLRWFKEHAPRGVGYRDHSVRWNSWMARPFHLPEQYHPTHWTADEGIRFLLDRDPTKPFFLLLSFARPHSPYDAPQVYFDMYLGNPKVPKPPIGEWAKKFDHKVADVDAPRTRRSDDEIHRARSGYYGNITFIDHQIGRVLYDLQRTDRDALNNTFILFTSDHGDMMGDHFHWRKTYAYEGSARVPFLVQYPEHWNLPRGRVLEQVVEMQDIMPTFLDAAGADIPDSVDGDSVLKLCRGDQGGWREYVQGEHTSCYGREHGMQYLTDGREKYIWFHHTGEQQFFNLEQDPCECRDLADDPAAQDRIRLWRSRLAEINQARGDPRGKHGALVPQPDGALTLSPNYDKWKQRAEEIESR